MGKSPEVEEKTETLLQRASKNGLSPRLIRAINGIKGGKPDDISIVVALVK